MISKLSELLRYSINSSENNFTTVEEELLLAKKYIEIQQLRFGSRIDYVENIDPDLLKEKMPLFVLQPLLENCIKHAVELTDEKISICNNISILDNQIKINISNNLPVDIRVSDKSLGAGIQNLRERLGYLYSKNYKLETSKNSANDFSVTIIMPIKNG